MVRDGGRLAGLDKSCLGSKSELHAFVPAGRIRVRARNMEARALLARRPSLLGCHAPSPHRKPILTKIIRPKVVLVNPCNPTGVALARGDVERAAELTRRAGAWLILDNT